MQVKSLCLYTKLYKKQRLFHLHATTFSIIFIDGEAGELGDIAHFLQALARMEHYLWLAEHGCREFFGCR